MSLPVPCDLWKQRMMAARHAAVVLAAMLVLQGPHTSHAQSSDICDPAQTGFHDPAQAAVVCYTGNFLTKMLTELNSGQNKTVEHVRVHLVRAAAITLCVCVCVCV